MPNPYLTSESRLLFAKTFHDIAAPLGALTLCVDDIKNALPESADLIEMSIDTLFHRISYWRLMLTGGDQSPTFSDAAGVIRPKAKLKSIEVVFLPSEEYKGIYVRLLLGITLLCIESLPRGGKITIDADNGIISAVGEKCFLTKDLQEILDEKIKIPTSRHSLGLLIQGLAEDCNTRLTYEHTPASLVFTLKNKK